MISQGSPQRSGDAWGAASALTLGGNGSNGGPADARPATAGGGAPRDEWRGAGWAPWEGSAVRDPFAATWAGGGGGAGAGGGAGRGGFGLQAGFLDGHAGAGWTAPGREGRGPAPPGGLRARAGTGTYGDLSSYGDEARTTFEPLLNHFTRFFCGLRNRTRAPAES